MNDIETARHSLSHVLASAVLQMFPEAKLGIGPAIDNGFYYDFELPRTLIPEDLLQLENKMRKIISGNYKFEKNEIASDEAIKQFKKSGQKFKVELIKDLVDNDEKNISVYTLGEFVDLCKGPHVDSTADLRKVGFKLEKIAGAYWRGDEKKPMLQRIYGLAFESIDRLKEYQALMIEAEKRDHRKLGKELGLFVFSDLVGPGLPLFTPKGALVRRLIQNYSNELRQQIGYQEVHTHQINKAELFKISGHYDKYKNDMLRVVSNYSKEEYFLKPMNCPQHTQIYAAESRSYKDLPIRIADFANLYRDEKPGELNGLSRLRGFSQDDGHCFCREDQIEAEFSSILDIIHKAMTRYGMEYHIRLSLRDEKNKDKYLGDDSTWEKSQAILEKLLVEKKIKFNKAEGEAAFYGPKMDLLATDAIGREWQLSTIQLDFNMPKRFNLEYIGQDGNRNTPVMIHSAIVGSPERFMGVLIEHFAGAFPYWLAPVQMKIVPISEKVFDYSCKVYDKLKNLGVRVDVDMSDDTLGKKIRAAEMQKIPYILIVGQKEVELSSGKELYVSVRSRKDGDLGQVTVDKLLEKIDQ